MDTACVDLHFSDGTLLFIDCIAVENEEFDNMYQCAGLDYLIYNEPAAYASMMLNGDLKTYLKAVTE